MTRKWIALALAAAAVGVSAGADEPREVKVIARGPWPHLPTHGSAGIGTDRGHNLWVIRDAAELAKRAGGTASLTVPKALKVESIDFKKQMLVVIEDGGHGLRDGRQNVLPSLPIWPATAPRCAFCHDAGSIVLAKVVAHARGLGDSAPGEPLPPPPFPCAERGTR